MPYWRNKAKQKLQAAQLRAWYIDKWLPSVHCTGDGKMANQTVETTDGVGMGAGGRDGRACCPLNCDHQKHKASEASRAKPSIQAPDTRRKPRQDASSYCHVRSTANRK